MLSAGRDAAAAGDLLHLQLGKGQMPSFGNGFWRFGAVKQPLDAHDIFGLSPGICRHAKRVHSAPNLHPHFETTLA